MTAIYKYPLSAAFGTEGLTLPAQIARVMHVGLDPATGEPAVWCVWSEVIFGPPIRLRIVATGEPFDSSWAYVGSIVGHRDVFVWHVFDASRPPL